MSSFYAFSPIGMFEVNFSKHIQIQGILGPCASLEKKGPLCSDTTIGQGDTTAWKMCEAYDASRIKVSKADDEESYKNKIYGVAVKTVPVRIQKAIDPEVAALLDDSDNSRFGSDVEDLEEDFVLKANLPDESEDLELNKMPNLTEYSNVNNNEEEHNTYYSQDNINGGRNSNLAGANNFIPSLAIHSHRLFKWRIKVQT